MCIRERSAHYPSLTTPLHPSLPLLIHHYPSSSLTTPLHPSRPLFIPHYPSPSLTTLSIPLHPALSLTILRRPSHFLSDCTSLNSIHPFSPSCLPFTYFKSGPVKRADSSLVGLFFTSHGLRITPNPAKW